MALIGKFGYLLTLDSGRFVSGLKRAGQATQAFSATTSRVATKLIGFGSAIAGAAGITGMGYMIVNSFKTLDALGKLSDELGVSVENLRSFQHAAALSGTSNETLRKGFQRLVRTLGEAALGYGEGIKGIKALGLNAQTLARMSPDKAMLAVADAIKRIPTETGRAAAAYALFGRQGQELMNFLLLGRSGLEAVRKEIDSLGGAVNRSGISGVEAFNDAMSRMKLTLELTAESIAADLAPKFEVLANRITGGILWTKKYVAENWEAIKGWGVLAAEIGAGIVSIHLATKAFGLLAIAVKVFGGATVLASSAVAAFNAVLALGPLGLVAGITAVVGAIAAAVIGFDLFRSRATRLAANARQAANEAESMGLRVAALAKRTAEATKQSTAMTKALAEQAEATQKAAEAEANRLRTLAQSIVASTLTPIEQHRQKMEELNSVYRIGAIDLETYSRKFRELKAELAERSGFAAAKKAIADRVAQIREATRTPMERAAMEIDELRKLRASGALDAGTFARAFISQIKSLGPDGMEKATGQFKQITRGFTDISGRRKQDATEKELPKITGLLADIRDLLDYGIPAVAAKP